MKLLILKIVIIILMVVMLASCSTVPMIDEYQQQDELNMYMISHGHYIPNHN
jgi:hypothetical protein